jgi:hypothetical protein
MKEIVSKTYCPLPFNHLYVHPTNMASVCCAFRKGEEREGGLPNIKEYKNLGDHLNHPFIKDIQQKMLNGERVDGCATCYYAEEHGYQSMREKEIQTWHVETFRDFSPPDLENPKLEFMEMTFGNYCNLACRTCHSDLSHSWIDDEAELTRRGLMATIHETFESQTPAGVPVVVEIYQNLDGRWKVTKFEMKNDAGKWIDCEIVSIDGQNVTSNGLPNHTIDTEIRVTVTDTTEATRINIEKEWHKDDFKDLQYIKITGGEPMLHPDFPKFMAQLEQANVYCFIFSNASWVPKKRIFDMLKDFKYLQVFLSVDGTGDVQEYMRHNAKWDVTEKSVRKWMEWSADMPKVQISWAPTWSLMNASYYVETCNWWLGLTEEILRDTKDGADWNLVKTNFIYGPSIYQMSLLPSETKEKLKTKASEYIEELNNSDIAGVEHIIEMTEAYIKFFDNDNKKPDDLKYYLKTTDALDEMRGQSLKKMIPLTYEAMYNRKGEK